MQRTPVASTNLRAIGYDSDGQTLEVEFTNGSVYRYSGVPQDRYDALMSASSVGSYFNANIKNSYSYVKL
jgi:hypothetical protein